MAKTVFQTPEEFARHIRNHLGSLGTASMINPISFDSAKRQSKGELSFAGSSIRCEENKWYLCLRSGHKFQILRHEESLYAAMVPIGPLVRDVILAELKSENQLVASKGGTFGF